MRYVFTIFLTLVSISPTAAFEKLPLDVVSGWEFKKSLSRDYKKHGYQLVHKNNGEPVRSGEQSLRFEVRAGDCGYHSRASDCDRDRERHELSSGSQKYIMGDGEYWMGWSIYVPKDFPNIYPTKTALGQFHQVSGRPAWMFQNKNGGLWIDNHLGHNLINNLQGKNYTKLLSSAQLRGRWNDIAVHVNWSDKADGFFTIYLNGSQKPSYDWSGATKSSGKSVYFKFGIYRSYLKRWQKATGRKKTPTQIVYFDEVRRGKTRQDIAPK